MSLLLARLPPFDTQNMAWFSWLSEPVRVPRRLHACLNPFESFVDWSVAKDHEAAWHYPWSDPFQVRTKVQMFNLRPDQQQWAAFVDWNVGKDHEAAWHYPWSEPKRFARALPVTEQSFVAFEVEPPVLEVEAWFSWLSEPKRFPRGLPHYLQQAPIPNPKDAGNAQVRVYIYC